MNETIERINSQYEFLESVIAADQALITALKEQRAQLRQIVEMLVNCADINRDRDEIKRAHSVLRNTEA